MCTNHRYIYRDTKLLTRPANKSVLLRWIWLSQYAVCSMRCKRPCLCRQNVNTCPTHGAYGQEQLGGTWGIKSRGCTQIRWPDGKLYIYAILRISSERWQEVRRLRWFAGISKCWKLFATCRNRTSCHCHRLCPVHRCHPWHPGSSEAPHPALRLWSLCPFHSLSIAFLSFARHLLGLGQCIPPICFLPFHWPSLLPCCQRGGPECHKITTPTRSPSSCMGNSWEWGGLSLGVPNNVINAFYLQLFELWVPRKIHWLWEWPQGGL